MQSDTNYRVIQLRQPDSQILAGLDTLHRAFIQNSPVPPEQYMDFVTQRLGDETMLLILAMDGETAVGYGLAFDVAEHPFMPEWERSGYITQVYVTPEHRRRRVGQLMVEHILGWMKTKGIQQVLLNILVDEARAESFWRKQGFAPRRVRMGREI